MQDYHAETAVNEPGASTPLMSALKSAIGIAALLAWLVLSVGGVEIARADPTQTAGSLIYQDGKAIGTAAPTDQASCAAATASGSARALADLQELVQQTAQQAARQPKGAEGGGSPAMALNGRGYNYDAQVYPSR